MFNLCLKQIEECERDSIKAIPFDIFWKIRVELFFIFLCSFFFLLQRTTVQKKTNGLSCTKDTEGQQRERERDRENQFVCLHNQESTGEVISNERERTTN